MDFPNWICIGDDRRVCAARNGVSAENVKTNPVGFLLAIISL